MLVNETITSDNFNKPSRHIRLRAIVKFSDTEMLDITVDNYMVSCSILEEVSNISGGNPVGDPSADEISLVLINTNGIFTPTNTASPYYGKMRLGVVIDLQFTEGDNDVWLPFRTYYVSNWISSANNITATITARSILQNYIKLPMPAIPVYYNITFKRAYEIMFASVGLAVTDYEISDTLTQNIDMFYMKAPTWGENIKRLAEASATYCFVNRYNKIIVVPALSKTLSVATVSQDNIINSVDQEQKILHNYGNVSVNHYSTFLSSDQSIVSDEDINLLVATSPVTLEYNTSAAVSHVESINISDALNAYVDIVEGASWLVKLRLNVIQDTNVNITVKGTVVDSNTSTIMVSLGNESSSTLVVDNYLIQNVVYARSLANLLRNALTCNILSYSINTRGNPLLEINDIITVSSSVYHVQGDAKIVQASYSYNGQLTCIYKMLNSAALEV